MQNADAISVLFFGFVVSTYLYPSLARRDIRIPTTYKFAIGTGCAVLSLACAMIVDNQIHSQLANSNEQVNILWQIPQFMLIGAGEIFAVSASYEAAFIIAPKEQKAFASAINLFFVGGVPNFISTALYNACEAWFADDYSQTQMDKFFAVLLGIAAFGVLLNILPRFVSG